MGGHYFGPYGTWLNVDDIQLTLVNDTGPGCPTRTATPTATRTPTVTPTIPHTPHAGQFEDVPPGSTFYDYVECMGTRAIISGYPCGGPGEPCEPGGNPYYRPGNTVTRGQLMKMVVNAAGWPFADPPSPTFADVPATATFYPFVETGYSHGLINGYPCGLDPLEPCDGQSRPYFRPNNPITRGQLSKVIALARAYPLGYPPAPTFEDVPATDTFYLYIEALARSGLLLGYPCGGAGEPCVPPGNRPYFRWQNSATRGQISKITAVTAGWNGPIPTTQQTFEDVTPTNPFWVWIEELAGRGIISGYNCGGPGEPCNPPGNRPYFRWGANATRGQMSKIAASSFFPNCQTPQR
jgi:hypothetical protein